MQDWIGLAFVMRDQLVLTQPVFIERYFSFYLLSNKQIKIE